MRSHVLNHNFCDRDQCLASKCKVALARQPIQPFELFAMNSSCWIICRFKVHVNLLYIAQCNRTFDPVYSDLMMTSFGRSSARKSELRTHVLNRQFCDRDQCLANARLLWPVSRSSLFWPLMIDEQRASFRFHRYLDPCTITSFRT